MNKHVLKSSLLRVFYKKVVKKNFKLYIKTPLIDCFLLKRYISLLMKLYEALKLFQNTLIKSPFK